MESSLHTLDACLALLLSYLTGKGNMGKPSLAVGKGGMQKGVHSVLFDVMLFTKWEVLEV